MSRIKTSSRQYRTRSKKILGKIKSTICYTHIKAKENIGIIQLLSGTKQDVYANSTLTVTVLKKRVKKPPMVTVSHSKGMLWVESKLHPELIYTLKNCDLKILKSCRLFLKYYLKLFNVIFVHILLLVE